MDDITEDYRTSLADLTCDSKSMIDELSKLAWDNETHAAKIVDVIETHLQQV
jgi:DNA-directed RNA polymerase subunit F